MQHSPFTVSALSEKKKTKNNNFEAVLQTKHFIMKWLFVPDVTRLVFEQRNICKWEALSWKNSNVLEALVSKNASDKFFLPSFCKKNKKWYVGTASPGCLSTLYQVRLRSLGPIYTHEEGMCPNKSQ